MATSFKGGRRESVMTCLCPVSDLWLFFCESKCRLLISLEIFYLSKCTLLNLRNNLSFFLRRNWEKPRYNFVASPRTRLIKNEFPSLLIFRSVDSLPNLRSGKLLRGIFREDEKAWCCLPCLPVSILPECVWWPSLICPCVGVDCLPSYFRRKTSCARLLEECFLLLLT